MQSKVERLALKTLSPQRKSFIAWGTTRSTLFAAMFLGEKFDCMDTAQMICSWAPCLGSRDFLAELCSYRSGEWTILQLVR